MAKMKFCDIGQHEVTVLWRARTKVQESSCKACMSKVEPKKAINKVSSKKADKDRAYKIMRDLYVKNNPICKANLAGCTIATTDVHHKAGRGENYLKVTTWLPVCRSCHNWIEVHPDEAKAKGFSENRL